MRNRSDTTRLPFLAATALLVPLALSPVSPVAAQDAFSQASLNCYQQAARGNSNMAPCEQAAEAGDAHAAFLLAMGERDPARRVERLQRAIELGHPRAAAVLAQIRRAQGDNERAQALELLAARGGYGPSRIRVAQALRADRQNTENLARARNILLAEAVAGYPQAQYLVAGMLKTGEGGAVDEAAAGGWMLEAASSGHVQAQFELGVVQGQSDPRAGQRWLTKAARAGHVGAMYQLARLINENTRSRNGKITARYWANRAILAGHPEAPALLVAIGNPQDAPAAGDGPNLVAQVQQALSDLGYDPGPVDGVPGGRTRSAIEAFQQSRNLPVTGEISAEVLARLRQAAASR